MKNNRDIFVVIRADEQCKKRRSISKRKSVSKKKDINEQKPKENYPIRECEYEKDIKENNSNDDNIINTFINNDDNKNYGNYPLSLKNLDLFEKEGKNILYKYNLIIDKTNIMEGSRKRIESKRENKEDYDIKSSKKDGEEGDLIEEEEEKMISDFMEKKRKRLIKKVNEQIDFEKKNLIDSLKEKREFTLLKKKLKINSNEIDDLLSN